MGVNVLSRWMGPVLLSLTLVGLVVARRRYVVRVYVLIVLKFVCWIILRRHHLRLTTATSGMLTL